MQKYNIHLPLGTLAFVIAKECPTSFLEGVDAPTLVCYPSDDADFSVAIPRRGRAVAYLDMIAALTYHFAIIRGIPKHSLDVSTPYGIIEIPEAVEPEEAIRVALPPTGGVFTRAVELLGGISERVSTVVEHSVSRVIENVERCPKELLSRLRVIDGLPTADRAISYKRCGEEYVVVTTDQIPRVDSISPLVRLLAERGVTGDITINIGERRMRFFISADSTPYAVYPRITHSIINT